MTEVNVEDLMVRIHKSVEEDRKMILRCGKTTPIILSMNTSQQVLNKYKQINQVILIKRHQFFQYVYEIPAIGKKAKSLVLLIKKMIR